MTHPPTIIVDLDNCIADDAWRIPRIDWKQQSPFDRYHNYHLLAGFDACANDDILVGARNNVDRVIVFTARPVAYRAITEEWLRRKRVPYEHLVMRNNNDHRPSLELKRTMLHWLPELYGVPWRCIVAAYDDRQDIVEMYRKHHISAYLRAVHDVCAYTPPKSEPQHA